MEDWLVDLHACCWLQAADVHATEEARSAAGGSRGPKPCRECAAAREAAQQQDADGSGAARPPC